MRKNQFLKVKNSLLELEKDFTELKDRELKVKEVSIKREIEKLFFKPVIVSIDDIDKFEKKEMKKIRPIKNTWYDWLTSYIPESMIKKVGGFKDKVITLFMINAPKQTVYGRGKKLSKPKSKNNLKKTKLIALEKRKKETIDRIIKDRTIRDIRTLLEQQKSKDYYKPKRVINL